MFPIHGGRKTLSETIRADSLSWSLKNPFAARGRHLFTTSFTGQCNVPIPEIWACDCDQRISWLQESWIQVCAWIFLVQIYSRFVYWMWSRDVLMSMNRHVNENEEIMCSALQRMCFEECLPRNYTTKRYSVTRNVGATTVPQLFSPGCPW